MFARCLDPALEIRLVGGKRLVEGEPSGTLGRPDRDLVRSVHHTGGIREADTRINTDPVGPTVRPDLDDARKDIREFARTRRDYRRLHARRQGAGGRDDRRWSWIDMRGARGDEPDRDRGRELHRME